MVHRILSVILFFYFFFSTRSPHSLLPLFLSCQSLVYVCACVFFLSFFSSGTHILCSLRIGFMIESIKIRDKEGCRVVLIPIHFRPHQKNFHYLNYYQFRVSAFENRFVGFGFIASVFGIEQQAIYYLMKCCWPMVKTVCFTLAIK